jgi:hypothetical protein
MGTYNDIDLHVTPSGDLSLGSNKDLSITHGSGVLKQDIAFRLRTNYGEFVPHPGVGADLDELIGEPNTREIAILGEKKIVHSLTRDGMVRSIDLYTKAVPISNERIVYYVFVNNGVVQLNVTPDVVFDAMEGIQSLPGE